ncbi:MAG TPA: DUF1854 domain-containing protein [Abditibacteriaceae bacterium]|nr:DUF1854 domain-containing protein [Abditibacteriaceae bacterium]
MKTSATLPAQRIKLRDGDGDNIVLHLDGQHVVLDAPRRALPLSEPERFIVLSDLDGQEVGVVRAIGDLDPESQDVLTDALERAYAIQIITRILRVEREPLTGQSRWRVETSAQKPPKQSLLRARGLSSRAWAKDARRTTRRGKMLQARIHWHRRRKLSRKMAAASEAATIATEEREFSIAGSEDVQTARYPRIYIVDTDGNRYEIPDCEALDLESRQAADRFF